MVILGEVWDSKWTGDGISETIRRAGKLVGVSEAGLNVDWMNQEKFLKADMLIEKESMIPSTPTRLKFSAVDATTPVNIRRNSAEYWKFKLGKVAEENEVQLAAHLNDPPAPILRGVERWNYPVFEGLIEKGLE